MKTMRKGLLTFLIAVAVFSSLLLPGEARQAGDRVDLGPPYVLSQEPAVLPDGAGGYYLLSSDGEQTALACLESKTGMLTSVQTLPAPYAAAGIAEGRLAVVCSFGGEASGRHSRAYIRTLADGRVAQCILEDTYVSETSLFALLPDGFAAVDQREPGSLRLFGWDGTLLKSLPAGEAIVQIAAGREGLYVFGETGSLFLFSEGELVRISGEVPAFPVRVLDGGNLVDASGGLWSEAGAQGPQYCCRTFSAGDGVALSPFGLLAVVSDRVLLLEPDLFESIGQFPLPEGERGGVFASGESALMLVRKDGGLSACLFAADKADPVQIQMLVPSGGVGDEAAFLSLWRKFIPAQKQGGLFDELPDLQGFSTAGRLSVESLSAGESAVNFYRALYGLPSIERAADAEKPLQYGAVVSLYRREDGTVYRPAGMQEDFFSAGKRALDQSAVVSFASASDAPLVQAVHELFRQSPAVREWITAAHAQGAGFGAASSAEAGLWVLFRMNTSGESNLACFPPPGVFPAQLVGEDAWSLSLPQAISVGERGLPSAQITDLTSGSAYSLRIGEGLSIQGGTLLLTPPAAEPGHRYRIRVENLAVSGLPAAVQWECSLPALELSPPVLPGDINLDGLVTPADEQLFLDSLLGKEKLTEKSSRAADLNGDGRADTIDLLALRRHLGGK